jgi:hypothetical protein
MLCSVAPYLYKMGKNARGPGYRSRYGELLRAWRSGDQIPVEARFSTPVQAHPTSCSIGTWSFSWGYICRGVAFTTNAV